MTQPKTYQFSVNILMTDEVKDILNCSDLDKSKSVREALEEYLELVVE
jgi:hypothetical protein